MEGIVITMIAVHETITESGPSSFLTFIWLSVTNRYFIMLQYLLRQ